MFFSSLLIALAITWLTAVVDTVVESARVGATQIVMFGRSLYQPSSARIGVWIVCALSASAMLAVVTAVSSVRGRRLRTRMAAELARIEQSQLRKVGDSALLQLLPNRIAELQTSVDILAAQRDALLDEIEAGNREVLTRPTRVVVIPDVQEGADVPAGAHAGTEPDDAFLAGDSQTGA
jgi:hypothetical protein